MLNLKRAIFFLFGLVCLVGLATPMLEAAVIMISPMACQPDQPLTHVYYVDPICLYVTYWDPASPVSATFYVPLYLPQGVSLKKFTLYYEDNGSAAADYLSAGVMRMHALTGVGDVVCAVNTVGLGSSPSRLALSTNLMVYNTVNNKNYSYCLAVVLFRGCSTGVKFCGAKIEW